MFLLSTWLCCRAGASVLSRAGCGAPRSQSARSRSSRLWSTRSRSPPASSPWGCLPGSAVPRVDAERSQGTARGASASLQRKWQQRSWILPILLEASLMFFHWLQVLRGVKFLLQSQAKRTVWRRPQHPPVGAAGASRPGTRVVRLHLGMSSSVLGTSRLSDIDKPEGD